MPSSRRPACPRSRRRRPRSLAGHWPAQVAGLLLALPSWNVRWGGWDPTELLGFPGARCREWGPRGAGLPTHVAFGSPAQGDCAPLAPGGPLPGDRYAAATVAVSGLGPLTGHTAASCVVFLGGWSRGAPARPVSQGSVAPAQGAFLRTPPWGPGEEKDAESHTSVLGAYVSVRDLSAASCLGNRPPLLRALLWLTFFLPCSVFSGRLAGSLGGVCDAKPHLVGSSPAWGAEPTSKFKKFYKKLFKVQFLSFFLSKRSLWRGGLRSRSRRAAWGGPPRGRQLRVLGHQLTEVRRGGTVPAEEQRKLKEANRVRRIALPSGLWHVLQAGAPRRVQTGSTLGLGRVPASSPSDCSGGLG